MIAPFYTPVVVMELEFDSIDCDHSLSLMAETCMPRSLLFLFPHTVLTHHSDKAHSCIQKDKQPVFSSRQKLLYYVYHTPRYGVLSVLASPRLAHPIAHTQSSIEKNHPFLLSFLQKPHSPVLVTQQATHNDSTRKKRKNGGNYFPLTAVSHPFPFSPLFVQPRQLSLSLSLSLFSLSVNLSYLSLCPDMGYPGTSKHGHTQPCLLLCLLYSLQNNGVVRKEDPFVSM